MPHRFKKNDKELIDQLFLNGYFFYIHPGWLDETDLFQDKNIVLVEDVCMPRSFLGIKEITEQSYWIQFFGCEKYPSKESLLLYISYMRRYLGRVVKCLYAISDSNYFSKILAQNGFLICDRIIQYSFFTNYKKKFSDTDTNIIEISEKDIPELVDCCENAFPPLWGIDNYEFFKAFRSAQYRFQIKIENKTAAYILAAVQNDNCHILRIAVSKEFQRNHLAERLLSHVLSLSAREHNIIEYSVNTNQMNSSAIALYQKFGFEPFGSTLPVFCLDFKKIEAVSIKTKQ